MNPSDDTWERKILCPACFVTARRRKLIHGEYALPLYECNLKYIHILHNSNISHMHVHIYVCAQVNTHTHTQFN